MKNISDFLNECLDSEVNSNNIQEANETIKDEKSFREAARAKFEEVFGDELDAETRFFGGGDKLLNRLRIGRRFLFFRVDEDCEVVEIVVRVSR